MSRATIMRVLMVQLGVALFVGGILMVPGLRRSEASGVPLDDWQIDDVVARLKDQGLEFRAVAAMKGGPLVTGAYLSTGDKSDEEVRTLCATPERISDWKGTVFCTKLAPSESYIDTRLWLWGDCYFRVGPFVFFGDPELRQRVVDALCGC